MGKKDTLLRVAGLSVDAARHAGSLALTVARRVAEPLVERRRSGSTDPGPPPPEAQPSPPEPPIADAVRPDPVQPPPEPDPAPAEHVDRDAVVVAESADPGVSAGGVGAQITIDEPWPGYAELNVKQVNAELADASPEMLAIVRLYESANRNRSTVLDAIDRRLAAISD